MPTKTTLLTAAVVAATGLTACGSSSSDSTSAPAAATTTAATARPATTATPAAAAVNNGAVTVDATEYGFAPKAITAPAGTLKVTLDNTGKIPHEFVLLKSAGAPGALKIDSKTQRVSESASVGEVAEIAAGKSATTTFRLKAGTYEYVCNIPAHYGLGMHGLLTVK